MPFSLTRMVAHDGAKHDAKSEGKKQGQVVTSGLCWYADRKVRMDCLEHHGDLRR